MHLNIGPGPHYAARGWVNLDIEGTSFRRDITGSLLDLPPEVCDVELAYCGHIFEHVALEDLASALPVLRNRMVPGGTIAVVGPDVQRAEAMHAAGQMPLELLNTCRKHDNPNPGGSHLWDCTEQRVVALLQAAGFREVRAVDVSTSHELLIFPIVSRVEWQCAVLATAWPDPAPEPEPEPTKSAPTEAPAKTPAKTPTKSTPAPVKRARKTQPVTK